MNLIKMGASVKYAQTALSSGAATQLLAPPASPSDERKRSQGGLSVSALPANTSTVWVGGDASVTNSNGYPLTAGQSIAIACDDPSRVWVYATATSQAVAVLYL